MDLRLSKRVKFGDHYSVEALGEAFNIFNHQNVTGVNSTGYFVGGAGTAPRSRLNAPFGSVTNSNSQFCLHQPASPDWASASSSDPVLKPHERGGFSAAFLFFGCVVPSIEKTFRPSGDCCCLSSLFEGGGFCRWPRHPRRRSTRPRPFNPQFLLFTANHLTTSLRHAILSRVCRQHLRPVSTKTAGV